MEKLNHFNFTHVFTLRAALKHACIFTVAGFQLQNPSQIISGHTNFAGSIRCITSVLIADPKERPGETSMWENDSNDGFSYAYLLRECVNRKALAEGKQVHAHLIKSRFEPDMFVYNNLISMYIKCGSLTDARQLFDNMPERNVVSWSAMVAGCAQQGFGEEALKLFCEMQQAGMDFDQFIFSSVVRACSGIADEDQGRQVHAHIIKTEFETDVFVGSALVDMYAKCQCLDDARNVFDHLSERDVITWSGMISVYAQQGHGEEALKLFCEMQGFGVKPNHFTFVSVLMACTNISSLNHGKQVHSYIIKRGFESYAFVGSALDDMYAKCGNLEDARYVFDKMPKHDAVSWNSMISGYAQKGYGEEALKLFCQMQQTSMKPDEFTFASVFRACANLATLEFGSQLHALSAKTGLESDICVGSALLDMYAKCGSIEGAKRMFNEMPKKDVVAWNAMIAGCAQHGYGKEALQLFDKMQESGVKPNHITFAGIICACTHAGLVDEGHRYFYSMSRDHGITPRMSNYACMVDLLGRAGHLDEADDFISQMTVEPDVVVWRTLLGACRIHGDMEIAKRAADNILRLEPQDAATYVLLSNMYAASGKWDDAAKVRKMMKDQRVLKEPGCSWIEVQNRVHAFVMGDKSHPLTEEIHAKLEEITLHMRDAGYVMNTSFVPCDLEQEQKEHSLGHHSEKLAIAFALITTSPGTVIRIFKNLRVCSDCHTATKFMSEIAGREIVVRDAYRFHHFKDGMCSCGDYW
eukprot:Gb_04828 [translate_table: standard]